MLNNKHCFNKTQLHHARSLATAEEVCTYAKSLGVSINQQEAWQILSEIKDEMLADVNGGVISFGSGNRGIKYR